MDGWMDGRIDGGDGFHPDPYKGKVSPAGSGRKKEREGENCEPGGGFAYRVNQNLLMDKDMETSDIK